MSEDELVLEVFTAGAGRGALHRIAPLPEREIEAAIAFGAPPGRAHPVRWNIATPARGCAATSWRWQRSCKRVYAPLAALRMARTLAVATSVSSPQPKRLFPSAVRHST